MQQIYNNYDLRLGKRQSFRMSTNHLKTLTTSGIAFVEIVALNIEQELKIQIILIIILGFAFFPDFFCTNSTRMYNW